MFKPRAWMIAGAVIATAGVAHAQDSAPTTADREAARAGTPWHQRFTYSSGVGDENVALGEADRLAPAWTLSQRWGVTVDVREAQRIERGPEIVRPDQAAVGAYFQFTPRVRLGGEVSMGESDRAAGAAPPGEADREKSAGVRIESAFRF